MMKLSLSLQHSIQSLLQVAGSQEDSFEFFNCLIDALHEEFVPLQKDLNHAITHEQGNNDSDCSDRDDSDNDESSKSSSANGGATEEWITIASGFRDGVHNKNRRNHQVTRDHSASLPSSPIAQLFAGKAKSVIRVPGHKDSATIEPFFSLQLSVIPANQITLSSSSSPSTNASGVWRRLVDALDDLALPESIGWCLFLALISR